MIESTFATVKARTRVIKGAGSRDAGLAMAFKLLTQAEKRWRLLKAAHLVALVDVEFLGVTFPDGQTRLLARFASRGRCGPTCRRRLRICHPQLLTISQSLE